MVKKLSALTCISIIVVCVDQITKTYIQTQFALGDSVAVWPAFFNLTSARNYGGAFGFLEDSHVGFRDFLMLSIPPLACLIILGLLYYAKNHQRMQVISLSFIFGGAVGNYLDRLHYGYVIDFIDVHWKRKYFFPTFNIADTAIVAGVLFLIYSIIKDKPHAAEN